MHQCIRLLQNKSSALLNVLLQRLTVDLNNLLRAKACQYASNTVTKTSQSLQQYTHTNTHPHLTWLSAIMHTNADTVTTSKLNLLQRLETWTETYVSNSIDKQHNSNCMQRHRLELHIQHWTKNNTELISCRKHAANASSGTRDWLVIVMGLTAHQIIECVTYNYCIITTCKYTT